MNLKKKKKIEDNDIKKIKKITLNNINNEFKIEEFDELKKLKYIESCTLNGFYVTNELVEVLNSLTMLHCLILNHCNFKVSQTININNCLNMLVITYGKRIKL